MKAVVVILIILALGLGGALLYRHNKAVEEKTVDLEVISNLTTEVSTTKTRLENQELIALMLETNKNLLSTELSKASNSLSKAMTDLAKTQKDAAAAAETAKAEMAKRDSEISKLSGTIDDQTKQLTDLNSSINSLGKQIEETERKLVASEGDREFLLKELKRLQVEKAELERQFNDLALLRSQISKLKEELSVARRLEWIRMGLYGNQTKKGAEMLMQGADQKPKPNYNLNVELKQDGSATVVPATNAPAK
jgi:chromosome segregation ATPase